MSRYQVNQDAVDKAEALIESNQYVLDSEWSEAQPGTNAENHYIERNGWGAFGQWHLALDSEGSDQQKNRYNFIYGDFHRVHRSGLIAAKQRAAQNDHSEIEKAADKLLNKLDEIKSN